MRRRVFSKVWMMFVGFFVGLSLVILPLRAYSTSHAAAPANPYKLFELKADKPEEVEKFLNKKAEELSLIHI